jgi:hypothetical protein
MPRSGWGFCHLRVRTIAEGGQRREPAVTLHCVPTFAATTALPYPHRDRATAGLRAALRLQAGPGDRLEWDTLTVTGPEVTRDTRGREWFTYRAEVSTGERAGGLPD